MTTAQTETEDRLPLRGEARTPLRNAPRPDQRPPKRLKQGEYLGRDGEILTFAGAAESGYDEFHIPEELKEPGWSYQFIAATVHNKPNHGEMREMAMNGWRPVKPSQLGGYFERFAEGRDHIEIKGLILMERPLEMTEAAKEREQRAADTQFGRHLKRVDSDVSIPKGFDIDTANTRVRRGQREEAPADLKPRYRAQVAPAGDE